MTRATDLVSTYGADRPSRASAAPDPRSPRQGTATQAPGVARLAWTQIASLCDERSAAVPSRRRNGSRQHMIGIGVRSSLAPTSDHRWPAASVLEVGLGLLQHPQ